MFLRGRLAVEVIVEKENVLEQRFVGIRNEGNTCYMNSVLQILYFIRFLRKNVV
jgi:ubiquitin C-terminal hydrolase